MVGAGVEALAHAGEHRLDPARGEQRFNECVRAVCGSEVVRVETTFLRLNCEDRIAEPWRPCVAGHSVGRAPQPSLRPAEVLSHMSTATPGPGHWRRHSWGGGGAGQPGTFVVEAAQSVGEHCENAFGAVLLDSVDQQVGADRLAVGHRGGTELVQQGAGHDGVLVVTEQILQFLGLPAQPSGGFADDRGGDLVTYRSSLSALRASCSASSRSGPAGSAWAAARRRSSLRSALATLFGSSSAPGRTARSVRGGSASSRSSSGHSAV